MHLMYHQFSPNLQQNSSKNVSNDPNLSQFTSPLNNINSIVIEVLTEQTKDPPQTRRKHMTSKKSKSILED